jgi:hypothetical protein
MRRICAERTVRTMADGLVESQSGGIEEKRTLSSRPRPGPPGRAGFEKAIGMKNSETCSTQYGLVVEARRLVRKVFLTAPHDLSPYPFCAISANNLQYLRQCSLNFAHVQTSLSKQPLSTVFSVFSLSPKASH